MFNSRWPQAVMAPEAEGGSGDGEAGSEAAAEKGGTKEAKGSKKADEGGKEKKVTPPHDEATDTDKGKEKKAKVPERPEWAPENFWNKDKGELNVEELAKGFSETKKKLSMRTDDLTKTIKEDFEKERFAKRPESAEKYELRAPKQYAEVFQFDEKDPLVAFARKKAFERGYSQEEFDEEVGAYIESEISKLPDVAAETKRLGEKGKERIERVDNWLSTNVSKGAYAALSSVATKAEVVVAIEELMQKAGAPAFVIDATTAGQQDVLTDAQVRTWMADPRYYDPQKREQKFVEKVDNAWRKLYPAKK